MKKQYTEPSISVIEMLTAEDIAAGISGTFTEDDEFPSDQQQIKQNPVMRKHYGV